jgi:hypothetical protein
MSMVTMMQLTGGPSTYNALMAIARRAESAPRRDVVRGDHGHGNFAVLEPRKRTSGGPRNRAAHLRYQRAYKRERFGVRVPEAGIAYFKTRAAANAARRIVRAFDLRGLSAFARLSAGADQFVASSFVGSATVAA